MTAAWLSQLPKRRRSGQMEGVASICSAHPLVIEAVLTARPQGPVLIEATCNQVNQEGGYTGMRPADFRRFVEDIAASVGFDSSRLIFGGDHLGPNPWRNLEAEEAMARAETMVAAYVEARFAKIHLDASMSCRGEATALDEELVADRAARLALAAEQAARRCGVATPVYVIGTEVPSPGGASHDLQTIEITRPEAALRTIAVHKAAFIRRRVGDALTRIIALVVQPGVEFDHAHVATFDPDKARALADVLRRESNIVFEAHSTDYQPSDSLDALVREGFAILKVGPALTFALREALYGLDQIATERNPAWRDHSLLATMERLMLAEPVHWKSHYAGSERDQRLLRHFSYSDRIRYYWPHPEASAAVARLIRELESEPIPETLVSQFLAPSYAAVRDRQIEPRPRALATSYIQQALFRYPFPRETDKARRGAQ